LTTSVQMATLSRVRVGLRHSNVRVVVRVPERVRRQLKDVVEAFTAVKVARARTRRKPRCAIAEQGWTCEMSGPGKVFIALSCGKNRTTVLYRPDMV
jgi:hypothetical protein